MVDADLAKSAARALQSPKAWVGCCDPATFGAVASFFGDAWLVVSAWPVPGEGMLHRRGAFGRSRRFRHGAKAGWVTATLPHGSRGSKPFLAILHAGLKGGGSQDNGCAPCLYFHVPEVVQAPVHVTHKGESVALERAVCAGAGPPPPCPFSLLRPVSPHTAARGSGGSCGLRARRFEGAEAARSGVQGRREGGKAGGREGRRRGRAARGWLIPLEEQTDRYKPSPIPPARAAPPRPGGAPPHLPPASPGSLPARPLQSFCRRRDQSRRGPFGRDRGRKERREPCGPGKCMVPGASAARQEDIGAGSAEPSCCF